MPGRLDRVRVQLATRPEPLGLSWDSREKLLDEISFEGPDLVDKTVAIDAAYVTRMLADIVKNEDLSRYVL